MQGVYFDFVNPATWLALLPIAQRSTGIQSDSDRTSSPDIKEERKT
jgi:hypothetical protein